MAEGGGGGWRLGRWWARDECWRLGLRHDVSIVLVVTLNWGGVDIVIPCCFLGARYMIHDM